MLAVWRAGLKRLSESLERFLGKCALAIRPADSYALVQPRHLVAATAVQELAAEAPHVIADRGDDGRRNTEPAHLRSHVQPLRPASELGPEHVVYARPLPHPHNDATFDRQEHACERLLAEIGRIQGATVRRRPCAG